MKRTLLILGFFLGWTSVLAAGPVGKVTYLDGDLTVTRNGNRLPASQIEEGLGVEDLDTFSTGSGSTAQITLGGTSGIRGTLILKEKTTIYLRITDMAKDQKGAVSLMVGSLAVKAEKMTGATALMIRGEQANCGIRGTEFEVNTNAAGDLLVVTTEGRVECDNGFEILNAVAGTAVEALRAEGSFRSQAVTGSAADFTAHWKTQRLEVLKSHADQAYQFYAGRYAQSRDGFTKAYLQFAKEAGPTIELWHSQGLDAGFSGLAALLREKKKVIGPLLGVMKTVDFLDRYRFHLADLRSLVTSAASSEDFYRAFDSDNATLDQRIASIRYAIKLYAGRNDGGFPAGLDDEAGF